MREDDARVGDQAAPVARVVSALPRVDGEGEVERAASAEVDRGAAGLKARAVGGDERVGFQELLVLLAEFLEAG